MTLAMALPSLPAGADSVQILSLQTGHSLILNTSGLSRVAVGDGRIAGVVPIGTSQLVVNGKAAGHTTIFVWTGSARTTYEISVSSQGLDDVAKTLRAAIDVPTVQVVTFNFNVIVRGTVPDVEAFDRINDILKRFTGIKFEGGGGGAPFINAVTIVKPLGNLQDEIAAIPGGHALRVDADSKGNVIISGSVPDATEAQRVLDKVKGLAGPYLTFDGKVIDRLATDRTSQVDVKLYILEVDNTAQSQLGIRLQTATLAAAPIAGFNQYTLASQPSFVGISNSLGSFTHIDYIAPTLDLLLQEGHAHLLSSPDLVTQPGQEATFLVGGEIPIPQSNGLGTISIVYKEYGVKLNVTPTILGNGGVEAKVAPEISDLDFADGVQLNGFVVPAFRTSKLSTDVTTMSGESIVMGGLLRRQESKNIQKIPLLGDIPILGQLFRSTSYIKNDSDVVFVMTPTIITR
jgi:Flp pilus assembly secretin CpaC